MGVDSHYTAMQSPALLDVSHIRPANVTSFLEDTVITTAIKTSSLQTRVQSYRRKRTASEEVSRLCVEYVNLQFNMPLHLTEPIIQGRRNLSKF
jgi:hypothetical protein